MTRKPPITSSSRRSRKQAGEGSPARGSASEPAAGAPEDGTALPLWIQPRAARDAVTGEREGMVAIRLQAPPVDGAANAALIRFLACSLGCPASSVRLLRGEKGRRKWVAVEGVPAAELKRRLLALSDS